jgi:hypothetical protein
LRLPSLDYEIAQRTEMQGGKDPTLLAWAAERNRILVTHDVNTIPKHAYERVTASLPMPGVIVVPEDLQIGEAIEERLIIVECSGHQVAHIPQ